MSLLLAADLSLTCPGLAVVEIETLKLVDGHALQEREEQKRRILYARAHMMVSDILVEMPLFNLNDLVAVAMEGSAMNQKYRQEETTAVRQAFYEQIFRWRHELGAGLIVVSPKEAKRALTGNGNADKATMLKMAISRARHHGTERILEQHVSPARITQELAWAIADAYGVGCAAAKIHLQRKIRADYARRSGTPTMK